MRRSVFLEYIFGVVSTVTMCFLLNLTAPGFRGFGTFNHSKHPPPSTIQSLAPNTFPLRLIGFLSEGLHYIDWDNWSSPAQATYMIFDTPTLLQWHYSVTSQHFVAGFVRLGLLFRGELTRDAAGLTRTTWFAVVRFSLGILPHLSSFTGTISMVLLHIFLTETYTMLDGDHSRGTLNISTGLHYIPLPYFVLDWDRKSVV